MHVHWTHRQQSTTNRFDRNAQHIDGVGADQVAGSREGSIIDLHPVMLLINDDVAMSG